MQIKIDSDIPLPSPAKSNGGRKPMFPWAELQVGQSFLAPKGTRPVNLHQARVRAQKVTGFKFAIRKMPGGGIRVWRVE